MQQEEIKRLPVILNLRAARKRQSAQTGFVHYCSKSQMHERETIPLFENFCFILALLRSKMSENIIEAKQLLQRLLAFEVQGHFPLYLHEFPLCNDRMLSLKLLSVFYAIFTDFQAVLGDTLCLHLERLIERIVLNGYQALEQRQLALRYEWMLKAYALPSHMPDFFPQTLEQIADILPALHMAYRRNAPIEALLKQLVAKWHGLLLVYLEAQEQEQATPKPMLLDFFLCDLCQSYPARLLEDHPIHLRTAMVYSFNAVKEESDPLVLASCTSTHIPFQILSSHPRQPYTLYWGSADELHSLVCDPKKAECSIKETADGAEFTFTLPPFSGDEEEMQIAFFCNLHPAHRFKHKATTFQLGQKIELVSKGLTIELTFYPLKAQGLFFGHLSHANRPLQCAATAHREHKAYDWQIALRSIKRIEGCVLGATLKYVLES